MVIVWCVWCAVWLRVLLVLVYGWWLFVLGFIVCMLLFDVYGELLVSCILIVLFYCFFLVVYLTLGWLEIYCAFHVYRVLSCMGLQLYLSVELLKWFVLILSVLVALLWVSLMFALLCRVIVLTFWFGMVVWVKLRVCGLLFGVLIWFDFCWVFDLFVFSFMVLSVGLFCGFCSDFMWLCWGFLLRWENTVGVFVV